MTIFIRRFILPLFLLGGASFAQASLISSVDMNTGFTSLSLKAGDYAQTLNSVSSMEFNYNLKHAAYSTSYTMSFFQLFEADGRKMPMTRFSLGGRWYVKGHNGERTILDQGVEGRLWRSTPFLGLSFGLANISVEPLNASVFEVSPRFGVEIPLSAQVFLQGQLSLLTGTSMGASEDRSLSYQGLSVLIGIIYSGD
ncbi:MAG TPA: hypothetical protein PL182_11395 [Pseudobdellovibrionaceae bacterium]|nr:hypothetical protein [Pseudobdellovibrionaceae bacterium]